MDIARRLLTAFGVARFVVCGEMPVASRNMLYDAGCEVRERLDDDLAYLVCVGLADAELWRLLEQAKRNRIAGVYIERQADDEIGTRDELEKRCFSLDYRKHPYYHRVFGYADLERADPLLATLVEPIDVQAAALYPMPRLLEERDLHMDMLREAGRRSDAHVIRYEWASQFIRPNDAVLDAACGLGYGTHVMRHLSLGATFVGIDGSDWAIDYANRCFGSGNARYVAGYLPDALSGYGDASFDVVVSFETLEHVAEPRRLLSEFARILRPGGRVVTSVPNDWSDETGADPNPYHFHVYTWQRLRNEIAEHFIVESATRQIASGCKRLDVACEWVPRPRLLESVSLESAGLAEAEWWLAVGMKAPQLGHGVVYRETVHEAFDGRTHLVDFAEHYENPWLVHGMVEIPYRLQRRDGLMDIADDVLCRHDRKTPDCGAALAVKGYGLLEQLPAGARPPALMQWDADVCAYLEAGSSNPHVRRWHVSLAFLRARLDMRSGDRLRAKAGFEQVASADVADITPTLGTKVVEAALRLGLLCWHDGETERARAAWLTGLTAAGRLFQCDWMEFYGNTRRPMGFAMNDAVEIVDRASACAQALSISNGASVSVGTRLYGVLRQSLRSAVRQLEVDLRAAIEVKGHLEQLTLERLERIHVLEAQLRDTEKAFRFAERLSLERLSEIQALDQRATAFDSALEEAKRLSQERLAQAMALDAQLTETNKALDEVKMLSIERLDRLVFLEKQLKEIDAAHETRVEQTDAAFNEIKALADERLERIHTLEAQLRDTEKAFRFAERLSLERLSEIQALDQRATAFDSALEETKRLSQERLAQLMALDAQLAGTNKALDEVKKLSIERLDKLMFLEKQLKETNAAHETRVEQTDAALNEMKALADERLERIHTLEAQLAARAAEHSTGAEIKTGQHVTKKL
ncbi:class I SAM-dependent methyltransferase [Burkholderia sp. TSV86]|uniref:class I SAM-dependent methyltransferase n=1 Tax=Burkholderia sp. TSV86 TaxID=1385594 RepID=UPI000755BC97|nr:class I SAM-dependent methyltransferase [Burkholderia sp. TSV86]KVE38159.1 hypothetical protein WS68_24220 [Burkholderia sp. TSV86]